MSALQKVNVHMCLCCTIHTDIGAHVEQIHVSKIVWYRSKTKNSSMHCRLLNKSIHALCIACV